MDHTTDDYLVECVLIYPGGDNDHRVSQWLGIQTEVLIRRSVLETLHPRLRTHVDISSDVAGVAPPRPEVKTPPTPPKKQPIHPRLRKKILMRDAYRCQICGGWDNLAVDHIIPESKGGTQDESNLQALCRTCNVRKGDRV